MGYAITIKKNNSEDDYYYKLTSLNFLKVLFQLFYYLYCVLLCEDCHIIVSYLQFEV